MPVRDIERKTVMDRIVGPMTSYFEPPRMAAEDEERYAFLLEAYVQALAPYPPSVLQKAWEAVFASHDRWTWPTPGQFLMAARRQVGP